MRHALFLIIIAHALFHPVNAITLTLHFPVDDTVLYVDDTVTVRYEMDSTYYEYATGTNFEVSPDPDHLLWFTLCPVELEGEDICAVDKEADFAGAPRYLIPATYTDNSGGEPVTYSLVSETVKCRVSDYSDAPFLPPDEMEGHLAIRLRDTGVKNHPRPDNSDYSPPAPEKDTDAGGGCGTGTALALLPALYCLLPGRKKQR